MKVKKKIQLVVPKELPKAKDMPKEKVKGVFRSLPKEKDDANDMFARMIKSATTGTIKVEETPPVNVTSVNATPKASAARNPASPETPPKTGGWHRSVVAHAIRNILEAIKGKPSKAAPAPKTHPKKKPAITDLQSLPTGQTQPSNSYPSPKVKLEKGTSVEKTADEAKRGRANPSMLKEDERKTAEDTKKNEEKESIEKKHEEDTEEEKQKAAKQRLIEEQQRLNEAKDEEKENQDDAARKDEIG